MQISLFFRLLGWRLRFYADATLKLLVRRWQLWVFVLTVTSPAATPLAAQFYAIGSPVRTIVEGGSETYSLTAWLAMTVVAVAWTAVQAEALRGGMSWAYLRTLPDIGRLETLLDHFVLLISDLPLLLPFAAYLITLPASPADRAVAAALALQLPVLQQLILRGSPSGILVIVTSLAAVLALCREPGHAIAASLLTAGPSAAYLLRKRWVATALLTSGSWWRWQKLGEQRSLIWNLATINLLALTQWSQLPARLALAIYVAILVGFGTVWQTAGFKPPVAAGLLLAGLVPLVFQVAALTATLRAGRERLLPLLASLGVANRTLLFADLLVLEAAFALLALGPAAMLYRCTGTPRAFLMLFLGGMALALLALLYTRTGSTRFLPKLIIACSFLVAGWMIVAG